MREPVASRARNSAGKQPSAPSTPGRVGKRVADLIAELRENEELDTAGEALAAIAENLAANLDAGAGMATAAVAKELRATVEVMAPRKPVHDELDDIIDQLNVPELRPAVRDPA